MASQADSATGDAETKHPDELKAEIDQTRASLTEKIGMLGEMLSDSVTSASDAVASVKQTVEETIDSAKAAVTDTVSNVKETVTTTVDDVVEGVKDTFDITKHVERRPWLSVSVAVLTGFVFERLANAGMRYYESHRHAPRPPQPNAMRQVKGEEIVNRRDSGEEKKWE